MSAVTGGHRTPLQPVKESVLSDSSPSHRHNKVMAWNSLVQLFVCACVKSGLAHCYVGNLRTKLVDLV